MGRIVLLHIVALKPRKTSKQGGTTIQKRSGVALLWFLMLLPVFCLMPDAATDWASHILNTDGSLDEVV